MMILGIDPGTTAVGYAALRMARGERPCLEQAGLLAIRSREPAERLSELHHALGAVLREHRPDAVAVEKLFFAKNAKTAMAVAEARGAILLTAALQRATVYEYTPAEIKKIVTGYGSADKNAVKKMVLLTVPDAGGLRARDDVFDAIAIALACGFRESQGWLPVPRA